ncbi:hypothetical protein O6P43_027994 [Quillaja saponaria]|uniref:Uncharacterized protein n=1 Tax=Quillaja saponaria TaxID=32244 RepID=A0AAD7L6A1_QUISA|nr:hypothetical protein O6P43_027994 [Quillaja saponaria]
MSFVGMRLEEKKGDNRFEYDNFPSSPQQNHGYADGTLDISIASCYLQVPIGYQYPNGGKRNMEGLINQNGHVARIANAFHNRGEQNSEGFINQNGRVAGFNANIFSNCNFNGPIRWNCNDAR